MTEHHRQELDIVETMGAPTRFPSWGQQFNFIHWADLDSGRSVAVHYIVTIPKDGHVVTIITEAVQGGMNWEQSLYIMGRSWDMQNALSGLAIRSALIGMLDA